MRPCPGKVRGRERETGTWAGIVAWHVVDLKLCICACAKEAHSTLGAWYKGGTEALLLWVHGWQRWAEAGGAWCVIRTCEYTTVLSTMRRRLNSRCSCVVSTSSSGALTSLMIVVDVTSSSHSKCFWGGLGAGSGAEFGTAIENRC